MESYLIILQDYVSGRKLNTDNNNKGRQPIISYFKIDCGYLHVYNNRKCQKIKYKIKLSENKIVINELDKTDSFFGLYKNSFVIKKQNVSFTKDGKTILGILFIYFYL